MHKTHSPLTTLACLLGLATLSAGCASDSRTETRRFDKTTDRVVIDVDAGAIDINVDEGPGAVVEAQLRWKANREPVLRTRHEGGTLYIEGDCPRGVVDCETDLVLTIPATADVELDVDAGDVMIAGLRGDLQVTIDNGVIDGRELGSEAVTVDLDNGSVDLQFSAGAEDIGAEADNGNVRLTVPLRPYHVDANAHNGSVDVSVAMESGADASIFARTDNGNITIIGD